MNDGTAPNMQSPASPSAGPIDIEYLMQRIQEVVKDPAGFFAKARGENDSISDIYKRYVIPLAAITPIGQFVSTVVYGVSIPLLGTYRVPVVTGLIYAVVMYAVSLLMVRLMALVFEKLAPKFGGTLTPVNSVKLVAYSMTPAFVAGLFQLIPVTIIGLAGGLVGLYSLYVLYQGIAPMSGVTEKRVPYYLASLAVSIILGFVVNVLAYPFTPAHPAPMFDGSPIQLPGGASINPEGFQRTVEQLEKLVPKTN